MDRKSKGEEVLDKLSDAVRVLLADDDKSCHLVKLAIMLQHLVMKVFLDKRFLWLTKEKYNRVNHTRPFVTPCKGAKNALDRLRKDTSRFHIMITKRNLLDMELLQKVEQEMNLLVIVMSRDGGIEAMQNNNITIHGVLKPITMNFLITLWQCVFGKNICNPAEVQQPTNDVPEGVKEPTPKKIKERMEAKGVKGLTKDIVKSHLQKWQGKLKKEASQLDMQGHNDKDGPSSVHVLESMNSATQLKRALAAMNISSQHQIGAPQIMTQTSSSGKICNELRGGTSINASTNLLANNPQNHDLNEIVLGPSDHLDFYWDFSNKDTFPDIDFQELDYYFSKKGNRK